MSVALGKISQASARHCFSYRHCAFRRIRAAAQREQPDSNVNRRVAALLAASIPPAVQTLAAEETDFSDKSVVPYYGVHSFDEEPPAAKTMVEQMGQLGAQIEVDKEAPTKVEDPNDPQGPPKEPAVKRQHLIVMRHGERIDEMDKTWSAQASRPYDPYLTPKGEEQGLLMASIKDISFFLNYGRHPRMPTDCNAAKRSKTPDARNYDSNIEEAINKTTLPL